MPEGLFRFTPALENPRILQSTLVGREKELKRLLRAIGEGAVKKGNQHFLLVGPRGIGKTHLLILIYHSVKGTITWDDLGQDLSRSWVPILFAEEEYRMTSLTDLFLEVLARLKVEAPDEQLLHLTTELDQVPLPGENEKELMLDHLTKKRQETGKKFLLLLDNLHDILPHFTEEDQGRLRDILMSKDLFMLIGTAPTLFDTVIDHQAPFYNFFEVIWLQEIGEEQVKELIARRLRLDGKDDLLGKLDAYEDRFKALVHLTGANPRLILSLYQIFAESKIIEVERDFCKRLDEMTPYFQDRMREIPPQQRKIVDALALADGPSTPTEIAHSARLPVNVTTSQLNRLKEAGFVRAIKEKGRREVLYDINERLFRLWRQMRVEAGRKRLRFIIKFIEIWFSPLELAEQAIKMAKDLEVSLSAGAFESAKQITDKLYYIQEAAPSPLREVLHFQRIFGLVRSGDLETAERETKRLQVEAQAKGDEELLVMALWENALIHLERGDYDEAIRCYRKALEIKPDMHEAWYNMGLAYAEKGEHDEAIKAFSKAIDKASDLANEEAITLTAFLAVFTACLVNKAGSYIALKKYSLALKDAEKAYAIAREIGLSPFTQVAASHAAGAALGLSKKSTARGHSARAVEHLKKSLKYLPDLPIGTAEDLIGQYFKDLLSIGNKAFMESAIQVIEESGQADLSEFLRPYRIALQYLEKKDRRILNRLVPEIREIVEEIIAKLEGAN
ncbi:tetratricopeptide repeat protein [Candidatus Bipolaricaulota bacterium]|nr:tetratricopeptide repeat protein [Candidatus Bipolaricaulota bacterium]